MAKISVIVPVYNAEKTIDSTIKSVLNQTFNDFELICINNCSNDKSSDILNSYVLADNRIKVYNVEKKSPGAVLNDSIGYVSNDSRYLYFVNQDDKLNECCLEKMLRVIDNKNIEMAVFSENSSFNDLPLCAGIIRKEFFINNKIKFSEENYDEFFMPAVIEIKSLSGKVEYVNEPVYLKKESVNGNKELNNYYTLTYVLWWQNFYKTEQEKVKIKEYLFVLLNNFIKNAGNKIILSYLIPYIKLYYRNYKRYKLIYYIKFKLNRIKMKEKALKRKNKGRGKMLLDNVDVLNSGKYTYCASQPIISDSINTKIGKFCSFGSNIQIGQGSHPINYLSTSPYLYLDALGFKISHESPEFSDISTSIKIGNDVWVGNNVCIKNGVSVGDGAVLGMGAVVTKDVPPYAIVGGVPAKIIKYRFDEQTIAKLLELKWWDLDDETIKQIPFYDINKAIDFLTEVRNNSTLNKNQH